jgi:hypothetical protein
VSSTTTALALIDVGLAIFALLAAIRVLATLTKQRAKRHNRR